MVAFRRKFYAGWGDMDTIAHMGNTAYLDKSATMRMMFFAEHGLSLSEFYKMQMLEEFEVSFALSGQSEDGSRFRLQNVISRTNGQILAKVTSLGGWIHLVERRFVKPNERILSVVKKIERTKDFESLPSNIKK